MSATSSISSLSQTFQASLTGVEKYQKFKFIALLSNQVGHSTFTDTFPFSKYGSRLLTATTQIGQGCVLQKMHVSLLVVHALQEIRACFTTTAFTTNTKTYM